MGMQMPGLQAQKLKLTCIAATLFLLLSPALFGQHSVITSKQINERHFISQRQKGGQYFTSAGIVKALLVFVAFKDDTFQPEDRIWPPNSPPTYADEVLDSTIAPGPPNGSLSHMFHEMSFGKFRIYGDRVFVNTRHPKSWYLANKKHYGDINIEVLSELDKDIDYSLYDRWTFGRNFDHINKPDGIVDLIMIIHRENMPSAMHPGNAVASLGRYGKPLIVENGDIQIKFSFPGSGISAESGYRGRRTDWYAHEIGHLFFGSGHSPYNKDTQTTNNKAFWGLQIGQGFMTNAYERERLGWIDIPALTSDSLEIVLSDFITTGDAFRVPLPNSMNESFIIENHQEISVFDRPNKYGNGSGIYIYHVNGNGAHPRFDVESAAGRYDWENPYWIQNPWETDPLDSIPVFKRGAPNPAGYDGLDALPTTKHIHHKIFVEDEAGTTQITRQLFGNETNAFDVDGASLFSPHTNPNSNFWDDRQSSGISIAVIGKFVGKDGAAIYRLKITITKDQ